MKSSMSAHRPAGAAGEDSDEDSEATASAARFARTAEDEGEIQKRMATFIPSAPAQGFLENGPESSAPA